MRVFTGKRLSAWSIEEYHHWYPEIRGRRKIRSGLRGLHPRKKASRGGAPTREMTSKGGRRRSVSLAACREIGNRSERSAAAKENTNLKEKEPLQGKGTMRMVHDIAQASRAKRLPSGNENVEKTDCYRRRLSPPTGLQNWSAWGVPAETKKERAEDRLRKGASLRWGGKAVAGYRRRKSGSAREGVS